LNQKKERLDQEMEEKIYKETRRKARSKGVSKERTQKANHIGFT
jgi:hypothetical protein